MPRVSILLPVYRAERTLALCLKSIARQRFTDWRCMVIDDGSDDGSRVIAAHVARHDPRFELICRSHEGLVPTLCAGLEACDGELIARMDADDVMHRDRLAAQVAGLDAHAHWAGVGCHVRLFPRRTLTDGQRRYERWLNSLITPDDVARAAWVECPLAHPTWMVRRRVYRELGYRTFDGPEDHDVILRALAAHHTLGTIPRRLHHWREHPRRLSRTSARYALDRFTDLRAQHLVMGLLAPHDDYVLWGYGATGKALQRALRRRGKVPRLIIERHPGRLGQRIAGAPVEPPEVLAKQRATPIIVSVAGAAARAAIRSHLARWGYIELDDFVMCA